MTLIPLSDGNYSTPAGRASLLARLSPSFDFYWRFALVVLRASSMAKRGRYGDDEWGRSSFDILNALEAAGLRFEITGVEHLMRLDGPCVIAGNHMSTLETVVLPSIVQPIRPVTFVVKAGLLEYPVFKHVMRSRNPIAVGQKNPRDDFKVMLTEGAERLSRGISVIVFPQGSRAAQFDAAKFNTIAVKLALRTGVPIVPFALWTSAWPIGRRIAELAPLEPSRKVRFSFGEPLTIASRGADEHKIIVDFIVQHLRQWAAEDGRRLDETPIEQPALVME